MPYSKHRRDSTAQNLSDFCPKCSRDTKINILGNCPKLSALYKKLCRNANCFIHKKKSSFKNIKKEEVISRVISNEHNLHGKTSDISCYIVDEFEEENADDIEYNMYKKIDATVEELDTDTCQNFTNTAGYKITKEIIKKTIVWPLRDPKNFKGLRTAPKGLLLFGPPGTGKTFLGKLIAAETDLTFFNVSPTILVSKWLGENEKMVRTMFMVAKARQPSILFIDEIDSILSKSCEDENGCMRRMRNEFLTCLGDSSEFSEDRITVIGATNRPFELDEGSIHKFNKRIYLPLPNPTDRKEILLKLLERECHSLDNTDVFDIIKKTEGYSVSDLKSLCQEAAMGPITGLTGNAFNRLKPDIIRPISMEDFLSALDHVKPTVTLEQIKSYETWNNLYGYSDESGQEI